MRFKMTEIIIESNLQKNTMKYIISCWRKNICRAPRSKNSIALELNFHFHKTESDTRYCYES